jgi:hypothetical protein
MCGIAAISLGHRHRHHAAAARLRVRLHTRRGERGRACARDGPIPIIPVKRGTGQQTIAQLQTLVTVKSGLERPIGILVSVHAKNKEFSLLHEVGHLLDVALIGEPGRWASKQAHPLLRAWREEVLASEAVWRIRRLAARDTVQLQGRRGGSIRARVDHGHLRYLLRVEELLARSYAQYITTRSDSELLRRQLDTERAPLVGQVYYPRQWDDDDFTAIAATLDQLFARLAQQRRRVNAA